MQVTVTTIIFGLPEGQRLRQLSLELPSDTITARELIAHKVGQEVAEYAAHRRLGISGEYLPPEVLTQAQASDALKPGTAEEECKRALQSFIAGNYMIVVEGRRILDPEATLTLHPEDRIEFIKILPLVGG